MDIAALVRWTVDQLEQVGEPSVYDGLVPADVPTLTGRHVAPYYAVWSQPLREHPEQPLAFTDQESAGETTVTAAGATPGTVRNLGQEAIKRLHRVRTPSGGEYRYTEPHVPVQYDTSATPPRYYIPMRFEYIQP